MSIASPSLRSSSTTRAAAQLQQLADLHGGLAQHRADRDRNVVYRLQLAHRSAARSARGLRTDGSPRFEASPVRPWISALSAWLHRLSQQRRRTAWRCGSRRASRRRPPPRQAAARGAGRQRSGLPAHRNRGSGDAQLSASGRGARQRSQGRPPRYPRAAARGSARRSSAAATQRRQPRRGRRGTAASSAAQQQRRPDRRPPYGSGGRGRAGIGRACRRCVQRLRRSGGAGWRPRPRPAPRLRLHRPRGGGLQRRLAAAVAAVLGGGAGPCVQPAPAAVRRPVASSTGWPLGHAEVAVEHGSTS